MRTTDQTATTFPPPPKHLSARAKQLWRELGPKHARSLQRRTLFQVALEALSTADSARLLIDKEGLISKTASTGALHVHPAAKLERESRQQFARLWDVLNLRFDAAIDGRG